MTIPTLESVQIDFQHWRKNKAGPRTRIPDELRQKALALLSDHSAGKIQVALGVSNSMLKAWSGKTAVSPSRKTKPVEFVALPISSNSSVDPDETLTLDLTQDNGNHWRLQGHMNASQLSAFIAALSGGDQ